MKGIVLAGGSGTRLHPVTKAVNKHLLPVYDKPMIYYPLSTLKSAGITDIMIITTPEDKETFIDLLDNGDEFGLKLTYGIQDRPNGIAEAFSIASEWLEGEPVTLILGDNIFYGEEITEVINSCVAQTQLYGQAHIFTYQVSDPERYGVIKYNDDCVLESIVEKPTDYVSDRAVIGVYCYPNDIVDVASQIKQSPRGELEITDVNNIYLSEGRMSVAHLGAGNAWLDTGTHDSLIEASMFVKTMQDRTNIKVGYINE